MIGTIEIKVNAARPNLPLSPMFAFKDSPSSLRIMEVPKKIVDWNITEVNAVVHYPDNTTNTFPATRLGNVWVVTFNGCSITGKVVNGLEITANGTDENENAVNGYVLGVGDIYILDRDADIEEAVSKHTMRYCEVMPETPVTGDVFIGSGALEIYDGTQWISIDIDLSEYATKSEVETTASTLDSKIDSTKTDLEGSIAEVASDIPTFTSELENDSGFITSASVPTKTSELTNDSGFVTSEDVPTKTSELTNDSNFITSAQVEPATVYGVTGYAANSEYATELKALDMGTTIPTDRGKIIPTLAYDSATNTYTLELYGSVGGYYPWYLRRLFGTDFSPVITLEWCKGTIYRKRGTRYSIVYNNNWMWLAKGKYAITCSTGDGKPDGNFYVLNYEDETHPNYINDPATDVHTITYNNNNITSIDGQAGGQTSQTIWCTRTNPNSVTLWERPFAYRNELPTKVSDLTNDAGYLTTVSWNDVQDKPSIPTKTSDLTNDSNYVNQQTLNTALLGKVSKSGDTVQWLGIGRVEQKIQANDQLGFEFSIDEFGSAKVVPPRGVDVTLNFPSTDGTLATTDYVTSQIPTKTSDLTNDSGFLTTVSWNDIQNKPDIPSKTSDLVNDSGFITSSDIPTIPTKTSDLTNDSDFTTNTALNTGLALKQDKLSDAQVSAIDSVVDERKTYFTFPNNDVQSAYVEGRLDTYYLSELNPELTHEKILTATEVKIGTAVTEIGYGAFKNCSNLAKVTIPDSVVTIGEEAFGACYALVRLEIPDGVSTINNLYNYTEVRADIVFGTGLQSISQGMFHYVSPNSVTFKGKTLAEVQAMADYPWDIEDTSIIKTENNATQEWVLEQIAALRAELQGGN